MSNKIEVNENTLKSLVEFAVDCDFLWGGLPNTEEFANVLNEVQDLGIKFGYIEEQYKQDYLKQYKENLQMLDHDYSGDEDE
jgi:hypothetical protein